MIYIKYKKLKKKKSFYLTNNNLIISGKLGKLTYLLPFKYIYLNSNKVFIPKNQFNFFQNKIKSLFLSVNRGWSYQVDLQGKGFKLFKYNNFLSFDLGYSNLILFKTNGTFLNIYSTKYKIIINSINKSLLLNIIAIFKTFYGIDKYHNKGIFFKKDKKRIYKKLM